MKIAIEDIPEEGLEVRVEEKIKLDEVSLISPVEGELSLYKNGTQISITGRLRTGMELQCGRCLKEFEGNVDMPVNVVYHPLGELESDRHELKDDEMDMGFYEGAELDLAELAKEQVLLGLPMKPLCDENCKGICPVCGIDLNTGACSCNREEVDPRMEPLRKFLEKRKE